MLSAGSPVPVVAPLAAAGAKGAKGAGTAAAGLGSTIASAVVPIGINTLVGGLMGGEKGAMAGLLGGALAQGTQSIMGGIFNKSKGLSSKLVSSTEGSAPTNIGSPNLTQFGEPSIPSTGGFGAAKASTVSPTALEMAAGQSLIPEHAPSQYVESQATPTVASPQAAPMTSGGGVRASISAPQESFAGGTTPQGDLLDRVFQQQRQLSEENYNRNMKTSIASNATKGLMGGIGQYFKSKSEEEYNAPYKADPEGALARGRSRAERSKQRQMMLRSAVYPSLRRG